MVRFAKTVNNPILMNYRSFITATFGEDALKPLAKVEEEELQGKPQAANDAEQATPQSSKWAVFNPADTQALAQVAEEVGEVVERQKPAMSFQPIKLTSREEEDTPATSNQMQTVEGIKANTTSTETQKNQQVAVGNDAQISAQVATGAKKMQAADVPVATIAEMQPSQVKKEFGIDELKAMNDALNVQYSPSASHMQLAAMLVAACKTVQG